MCILVDALSLKMKVQTLLIPLLVSTRPPTVATGFSTLLKNKVTTYKDMVYDGHVTHKSFSGLLLEDNYDPGPLFLNIVGGTAKQ